MAKRSNSLIGLGLAVFALGVISVLLVLRNDDGGGPDAADRPDRVLVASAPIPAGTTAEEAIEQGLVELRRVPDDAVASDSLGSTADLNGKRFVSDLGEGEQVRSSAVAAQTLRAGTIRVPQGKEGMAVRVPFVPAGAGYVGAGDRVNVYAVVTDGGPVQKVLADVEVLDVSVEIAPRRATAAETERASGDTITYLLAVDAAEAQQLAFLVSNESVYLTLARGEG